MIMLHVDEGRQSSGSWLFCIVLYRRQLDVFRVSSKRLLQFSLAAAFILYSAFTLSASQE